MGCGTGRNLPGFLKSGQSVYAVDYDFDAVSTAQSLMQQNGLADKIRFAVANAEHLPFTDNLFNEVHCIEILHWASSTRRFEAMWMESWRVLQPGGSFFTTLRLEPEETWFIADDVLIDALVEQCHAEQIKRTKSSLVLRKKNYL